MIACVIASYTVVDKHGVAHASPVAYLEFPGGHHGFDLTDGDRTVAALAVISAFLASVHDDAVVPTADVSVGRQ